MPLNRAVRDEYGEVIDIIAGDFFLCGLGDGDFVSLPKELQEKYAKLFEYPETFLRMGKGIMVIPVEPAKEVAPRAKPHDREER